MNEGAKKMAKVKFSHDIDESLRQEFDKIAAHLPGKKHEVVEAMIIAFNALPVPLQENLLSKQPEIQQAALAHLVALQEAPKRVKGTRKAVSSKAG